MPLYLPGLQTEQKGEGTCCGSWNVAINVVQLALESALVGHSLNQSLVLLPKELEFLDPLLCIARGER